MRLRRSTAHRGASTLDDPWPGLGRWIVRWLVKVVVVGLAAVAYLNMGAQLVERLETRGWAHLALIVATSVSGLAILSAVDASWQSTARRRQLALVSEVLFLAICVVMTAYGVHASLFP